MDKNEWTARNHIAKLARYANIIQEKNLHIKDSHKQKYVLNPENSLDFGIESKMSIFVNKIQLFFLLGAEAGIKCAALSDIQSANTTPKCKNSCTGVLSSLNPEEWTRQDLLLLMDTACLMINDQSEQQDSSNSQKPSKESTDSDQQQSSPTVEQQQEEQSQTGIETITHSSEIELR